MTTLFREQTPEDGTIRLEKDEDGYALWHHGRVVWREPNIAPPIVVQRTSSRTSPFQP